MNIRFVCALVLLMLPVSLLAEDQGARPDIEEMLKVSQVEKVYAQEIQRAGAALEKRYKDSFAKSPAATEVAQEQEKAFKLIEGDITWEKVKPLYEKAYAEVYTPEEVKGIIAFFKSPAGQDFVAKEPLLVQKLAEMRRNHALAAAGDDSSPAPSASGSDTAIRPDIQDLFAAGHIKENYIDAQNQMKDIQGKYLQQFATAAGGENMAAQMKALNARIEAGRQALSWDNVKDDMAKVYEDIYTPEEAQGLTAFYKSPPGQAYVGKKPLLLKKTGEILPTLMTGIIQKIVSAAHDESDSSPTPAGVEPGGT